MYNVNYVLLELFVTSKFGMSGLIIQTKEIHIKAVAWGLKTWPGSKITGKYYGHRFWSSCPTEVEEPWYILRLSVETPERTMFRRKDYVLRASILPSKYGQS